MLGVFSVGRIINPVTARSQLIGAMTMGIGMALHEHGVMDPRFGTIVNHDSADYHIPTCADTDKARQLVDRSALDRGMGRYIRPRLRTNPGRSAIEPITSYRQRPAERVIWEYLAEARRMIAASDMYEVLSHIDYAVRYWPAQQEGPFNPRIIGDAFRQSMRDLAGSGRALEVNVGGRLRPWIPQWWSEEGGRAITLASDAHTTDALANNFFEAMAMAEHFGFRQGRQPEDFWTR